MDLLTLDTLLFFAVNHGTSHPLLDSIMPVLTGRGVLLLFLYPLALSWKGYKEKRVQGTTLLFDAVFWALLMAFLSFLMTDWISNEMKNIFLRARPCKALQGVNVLVGCTSSGSMPSNHASGAFAMAFALFYCTRKHVSWKAGVYPFVVAALISYSRVYVGVHYPSDILAGGMVGAVVSLVMVALLHRVRTVYRIRPASAVLFTGLAALSLFRIYYILHGPLDLSPDEAHYWEWSRRLDLSYYSKGPMISYLIFLGTSLFGDTVFGIRIMAVLFSVASSLLLFRLVNILYGNVAGSTANGAPPETYAGCIAALLLQVVPLFAPFGVVFSIDSPFIFFWVLSLLLFWVAVKEESRPGTEKNGSGASLYLPWVLLGISVGLGLLTKYTMVFFYVSAFLFLLISEKRFLLKTGKPYTALLVSLLVFSPVIIWNMHHDWVTIKHTAGQAHVAAGFVFSPRSFFEFLGSQVGVVTPFLFLLLFYSLFALRSREGGPVPTFLLSFSLPILFFFLIKSIQGKVQVNWAITGYITGLIAFSRLYFGGNTAVGKDGRRGRKILLFSTLSLVFLVFSVSHYPSLLQMPPKKDPSSRLRGWKELGREATRMHTALSQKGHVLLFSDSYQVASELAFYVEGHPRTFSLNLGRRMNQYDLWPDMNAEAQNIRRRAGSSSTGMINGIFVTISRKEVPREVARAFDSCEKKTVTVTEREYLLREYSLFICYNFKGLEREEPATF
ncbi:MAG: glycosyltransferase family 39 protein [Nitrospirales bacterium]|nr:glycosyltransferase family 39 protein [Nitrospirales bacterium]